MANPMLVSQWGSCGVEGGGRSRLPRPELPPRALCRAALQGRVCGTGIGNSSLSLACPWTKALGPGIEPAKRAARASDSAARFGVSAPRASSEPLVVLTREKGKNEKLREALAAEGITAFELPLIEHREGPDFPKLQSLLESEADSLSWIAVTSPEAAAVFLEAWRAAGCPKVRLAVVGGGTADAFKNLPANEDASLTVGFTPSKATAKTMAKEVASPEGTAKVLYPASLKASTDLESGLRERGYRVIRLNTYSTESASSVDPADLALAAQSAVATFASPTAVQAWSELVVPLGWEGSAACIGETSAAAARKAGMERVYFPEKPGIEGWVTSVLEALEVTTATV